MGFQAESAGVRCSNVQKDFGVLLYRKPTSHASSRFYCLSLQVCGRVLTKDFFQKRAHAVSEGIGNRSIFTSYECDDCNQRFADHEENELGELFICIRHLEKNMEKKGQ